MSSRGEAPKSSGPAVPVAHGTASWKIGATLGVAAALLGVALTTAYRESRVLAGVTARVAAAERAIGRLDRVVARILAAETAERGYVITGEEGYAADFDSAVTGVRQTLAELAGAPGGVPPDSLALLSGQVDEAIGHLGSVILARRRRGFAAGWALIRIGRGERLMGDIRHLARILADGAAAAVVRETQTQQRASGWVSIALLAFGFLALALVVGAFGLLRRDVTRQRLAARQAQEREAHYRLLFDANPGAMWVYDRETLGFLAVNDAATRHYGYSREEFLALTIRDIRPPSDIPQLEALVRQRTSGPAAFTDLRHRKKDGTVFEVEISVDSIEFAGRNAAFVLALDVSERRRLEEQFRQAQKLEAVGRLAGGIAHDFNNMLTAIVSYSALLLEDLPAGHPRRRDVQEILGAADRATALTRQLLAFSRKQVLEPRVLDLNALIANLENLLSRVIGDDVELVAALDPALGSVKADPGQIEQVIVNLAVNARDAMPDGGKLTLETADVELDDAYAREHPSVAPGRYVMLAVSDTGIGMDEATQARIFEPFFTTKPQGQGTGLGLATVYGIVKQSGGNVWMYSEPGRGTTFKIYLPRVDAPAAPLAPPTAAAAAPRGDETVLLVEDEPAVRRTARKALERLGYAILEAPDAATALNLAGRHQGPIHLLLTDVVMPGMDGRDLARRLVADRPGTRVVFMSGYAGDAVIRHGLLEPGVAYLEKPFTPTALADKVRKILDSPP